jgi:hypothetical protein
MRRVAGFSGLVTHMNVYQELLSSHDADILLKTSDITNESSNILPVMIRDWKGQLFGQKQHYQAVSRYVTLKAPSPKSLNNTSAIRTQRSCRCKSVPRLICALWQRLDYP